MSDCKVFRREIEGAADGGSVGAGARAHAALCRACAGELRGRESVRALVGGLGKVEAPADFEFRLRARMAAAKSDGGRGRFGGRWLYGFAPVAVAACFVLISATLYLRQAARKSSPAAPAVANAPARAAEPDRATSVKEERAAPAASAAKGGQVATASPAAAVVSSKPFKAVRRPNARGAQAREVASRGVGRADSAAQRTAVSSVTTAPVLRPATITLKAPGEPPRMILRDERGAQHVVPMRAVSFGSQDVLAREAALKQAGAAEVGGVW